MDDHPVKTLRVSTDPLAFGRSISIHDQRDRLLYQCRRVAGLVHPGWDVFAGSERVAEMSWLPAFRHLWKVVTDYDQFEISQRALSLSRVFDIDGGAFAGAVLSGSLLDYTFVLTWNDVVFAKGRAPVLTLLEDHVVGVYSPQHDVELLTVVAMVAVHAEHLDKLHSSANSC